MPLRRYQQAWVKDSRIVWVVTKGHRRWFTTIKAFQNVLKPAALNALLRENLKISLSLPGLIRALSEMEITSTIENNPSQNVSFATGLDHALWAIDPLFSSEHLTLEEVARGEDGLVLLLPIGAERFAIHLSVTRWDPERDDLEPAPALLAELCLHFKAIPLQLRVNLTPDGEGTSHRCFGEEAFRIALRTPVGNWKRHLLGDVPAMDWLNRAGRLSTLRIQEVKGGWPYAILDGKAIRLPQEKHWCMDNPPLDPGELCRSVHMDDECWLFTCECSVPYCGGIHAGVLVAHEDGLVVWRSPEYPEVPLAIFSERHYRKVVFAAMKRLLEDPPAFSGLNWTQATSAVNLCSALAAAKASRYRI